MLPKTTIPCHTMPFWTKDEQLLDCSLVFWHSRGPLKVGCQGPPMAFEFNFWGSRYVRRSRFKLPHRLHGVLGFHVKPVATLKVELFHPAFLQGLPKEKVENFGEISLRVGAAGPMKCVMTRSSSGRLHPRRSLKRPLMESNIKAVLRTSLASGYLAGTNLVSWLFQLCRSWCPCTCNFSC